MTSRKSILGLGICAALAYAGHDWYEKNVEVVTVHATGAQVDSFPRVFIVDDPPVTWIRAERPDRIWLRAVRDNPRVLVQRGDQAVVYDARVGEGDPERVDRLFREKYGAIDRISGWLWRRDAVPIQLQTADS